MMKKKLIKSFDEWVLEESFWKSGINRAKTNDSREEDALGHHKFTDGNGKSHKHGVKIKSEADDSASQISEIIYELWDKNNYDDRVIDLNFLDMSGVENIMHLFGRILSQLATKIPHMSFSEIRDKLRLDTSGWVLTNCTNMKKCLSYWNTDCGADNWKVNPDNKVYLSDFSDGYYQYHYPKWFKFDIQEWCENACKTGGNSHYDIEDDVERTKSEGEPCYKVKFHNDVKFKYGIPNCVTIESIDNESCRDLTISVSNLTSLKKIPSKINYKQKRKLDFCTYIIDTEIIEDDEIIIPENISKLSLFASTKNLDKLPKYLPCDLVIRKREQLLHFDEIDGDVYILLNDNDKFFDLNGCPKRIGGSFDLTSQKLMDLKGCPEEVGTLILSNNPLRSLEGCPKRVNQDLYLNGTELKNIDYFPEYVGGNIDISYLELDSFEGLPDEVNGNLRIDACLVKSLKGLPTKINGVLDIEGLKLNGKSVTPEQIQELYPTIKNIRIRSWK